MEIIFVFICLIIDYRFLIHFPFILQFAVRILLYNQHYFINFIYLFIRQIIVFNFV